MSSPFPNSQSSIASPPPAQSTSKTRHSDIFRPKLPLDPFRDAPHQPWTVKIEHLVPSNHPQVILVLGAPSFRDLSPLLYSSHLSNSLLLIATHVQPSLSRAAQIQPTVRILRLSSPLAIEDAGAVRFVNVLEHAERVARLWRKNGDGGVAIKELDENDDGVAAIAEPTPFRFSMLGGASPSASRESLRPSSTRSHRSSIFSSKPSLLPPVDPSQRPFDALFNFLPSTVPDKSLLKQSILVTTISRPFLFDVHPSSSHFSLSPSSYSTADKKKRRSVPWVSSSMFSHSPSYSAPPTPIFGSQDSLPAASSESLKAHLIHLLPPSPSSPEALIGREKLVDSMDSFLLNFSYPPTLSGKDRMERATPYFLPSSILGDIVPTPNDTGVWSIADILLCGVLDHSSAAPPVSSSKSQGHGEFGERIPPAPRAWIPSLSGIVVSSPNSNPSAVATSSTLLSVPIPIPSRPQQRENTVNWHSTSAPDVSAEYTPPPTPPNQGGVGTSPGPRAGATFRRQGQGLGDDAPTKVPTRGVDGPRTTSQGGSSAPRIEVPTQWNVSPIEWNPTSPKTEIQEKDLPPPPPPRGAALPGEKRTPRTAGERTLSVPWLSRRKGAANGDLTNAQSGLPTPPDSDKSSASTNGRSEEGKQKSRMSMFFGFASEIGHSTTQGKQEDDGQNPRVRSNSMFRKGDKEDGAKGPMSGKSGSVWKLWGGGR